MSDTLPIDWRLAPEKIRNTTALLIQRIEERFPERSIVRIGYQLNAVTEDCIQRVERLSRPMLSYRIIAGLFLFALFSGLLLLLVDLRVPLRFDNAIDLVQGLEAGINDLIFLSIAVYFMVSLESRVKRNIALQGLRELRALAHIVDMHQLTKDPDGSFGSRETTASSPVRDLSSQQLHRYLDYCSEMLAMIGKLAALLVQDSNDPVLLAAVDEVEDLTVGLSQKIWQKIMILHVAKHVV